MEVQPWCEIQEIYEKLIINGIKKRGVETTLGEFFDKT